MRVLGNFAGLLRNENMKIYRRVRTYIMGAILVGLVLMISIMWAAFGGMDVSMWDVVFLESSILFFLVTIFTVVVAAGVVAEEFTSGTIKLLLIRPWSRSKILLAKYIAVVAFALSLAVLLFISSIVVNWLIFDLFNSVHAEPTFPMMEGMSAMGYLLQYYGLTLITTVMTVTLAFMLSTVFRSSGLAIGFALFLLLVVNNVVMLLAALQYKWVDYLLFVHLNLTQYLNDIPIREGMSLGFSLAVLAGYYVLFMALTWYVFNKRDVAA
ncbi:ABC transporter permease [Paenibacillus sp. J5C_2022]|uniref:ABC transporter permease n=1 Tax=Paenibacillus sp. J5C2022 TaxID=2977129 RepID=UPI0021D0CB62|nr:ABC transporter permease [Paenibacillus sp. J5C2022]MCU6709190.1 ABC transporter permease [Paenibacillus sp. J5C2022]